jgi:uncharacterized protein YaaQ
MKLLICVVSSEDTYRLLDVLAQDGYNATLISTTGGFLRQGNSTILIGVADEDVNSVLRIVKANCHTRVQYVNPLPVVDAEEFGMLTPLEVTVSGAVVFILNVERFEKF